MNLHRAQTDGNGDNPRPINVHSGRVNGGAIYGENSDYEHKVLRVPGTCRLRESVPGYLPITSTPDADGKFRWIAGDGRVDEHSALTTMHTVCLQSCARFIALLACLSLYAVAVKR